MRKALIVLVIPVLVCGGCSSRADVRAAPECPGSMSTDFDLGTVLRSAIPQLPRSGSGIDTGAPTVTIAPESRKRIVAVRLCAPNYSHEETVDAATALGQADRPCPPMLGDRVIALQGENYSTRDTVFSRPFAAAEFRDATDVDSQRDQWSTGVLPPGAVR